MFGIESKCNIIYETLEVESDSSSASVLIFDEINYFELKSYFNNFSLRFMLNILISCFDFVQYMHIHCSAFKTSLVAVWMSSRPFDRASRICITQLQLQASISNANFSSSCISFKFLQINFQRALSSDFLVIIHPQTRALRPHQLKPNLTGKSFRASLFISKLSQLVHLHCYHETFLLSPLLGVSARETWETAADLNFLTLIRLGKSKFQDFVCFDKKLSIMMQK